MRKSALYLFLAIALLWNSGCQTSPRDEDFIPMFVNFHLEATENERRGRTETLNFPDRGLELEVNRQAVFTPYDIRDVELIETRDGPAFAFYLNQDATRDFMRNLRERDRDRHLVAVISSELAQIRPIFGAAPIRRSFSGGVIYMYLEFPNEEAENLAFHLSRTARAVQSEIDGRR